MLPNFMSQLVSLPRGRKKFILITFDIVALGVALWMSFSLRLDRWEIPTSLSQILVILSAPAIALPIFVRSGLYRSVVRYLPERALWTILRAVTIAVGIWGLAMVVASAFVPLFLPRSVPVIFWALASIIIVSSRFFAKWLLWPSSRNPLLKRPALLVYGAGKSGTELALSLRSSHFVVGFLDDNPSLVGRDVAGLKVYSPTSLETLVRDFGVKQVVLSMPSLNPSRRKDIVTSLVGRHVTVRFLPSIGEMVAGKYLVSQVKEIEIDDLLGRSSVPPDTELISAMVSGRAVMVTGAGGSIGTELCKKIALWKPKCLVLLEANEFALYQIERVLSAFADVEFVPVLGSVTDAQLVRRVIGLHGVDAVFHAAAHKHVPLVEANPLEGIRNNVFGTHTLVELSFELGVKDFVLISTDKAVRPTNVMGATKRWAELLVQQKALQSQASASGQRFCAVRFGNVLGSNGSVVPLFKEQIARGGPITLTDTRMTRYFMSIKEAAELIVQAGALSENGDVFLLDMGEPILISDLAENMVRLAGLTVRSATNPDGDIEIIAMGKRPGEKMYEELFYDESTAESTRHQKIRRTVNTVVPNLDASLSRLQQALDAGDVAGAREVLFAVVALSDTLGTGADGIEQNT